MKPDRDVSIDLHKRVSMRYVLGNFTETQAANQNNESAGSQMQTGVARGRKPVLQKPNLLLEPAWCHVGVQPFAVRTNRSVEKRSNASRFGCQWYWAIVVSGGSI